MNTKNQLNPTRIVAIAIGAVAVLGVLIVGSRGEDDSAPVPPEIVQTAAQDVPSPPATADTEEPAPQDFDSWVEEPEMDEEASDDSASDSGGSDGGAAQAESGSDFSGEAAGADQPVSNVVLQ